MPCANVGPVGERARERLRRGDERVRRNHAAEEAPRRALVRRHRPPGVEELGRAPLPDHPRQQRARAHVAAREPDAHEQERRARRRRSEPQIGGERDHRAGARAHAVDGRDDRLRAVPHRLHEIARHPGEGEELRHRHPRQRADDLVDVAARAEVAARPAQHDRLDVARVDERAKEVAQLRVGHRRSADSSCPGRSSVIVATARRRRPPSGSGSRGGRGMPAGRVPSSCAFLLRGRCLGVVAFADRRLEPAEQRVEPVALRAGQARTSAPRPSARARPPWYRTRACPWA